MTGNGTVADAWLTIDESFTSECLAINLEPTEILPYFDGRPPLWADLIGNSVPRRGLVGELVQDLTSVSPLARVGMMRVILGPSGEGKSTILMQVALDLVGPGNVVLWRRPSGLLTTGDLNALPLGPRYFFLSDDADELVDSLDSLVTQVPRSDVIYVLAARSVDWAAQDGDARPWTSRIGYKKYHLSGLDEYDAGLVVAAWEAFGDAGLKELASVPAEERVASLMAASHDEAADEGAFLGAMLRVRYGEGLTDRVRSLLRALTQQRIGKRSSLATALLLISAAHRFRLPLSPRILAQALDVSGHDVVASVVNPLRDEALISRAGDLLFSRHKLIADAVIEIASGLNASIPEIYANLVRSAIQVGRHHFVPGYEKFTYLGKALERAEPKVARAAAEAAADEDPDVLDYASNLAHVLRVTGEVEMACGVNERTVRRIHRFRKTDSGKARTFYRDWAAAEGANNRVALSVWLSAVSLSDMPGIDDEAPSARHVELALAGVGGSLMTLGAASGPSVDVFRRGVRAAETLGKRLDLSVKAAHFFSRQRDAADEWAVSAIPNEECVGAVKDAVSAAWQVRERDLKGVPAGSMLSFKGMSATLLVSVA